jgi:hypothetical protein
LLENAIGAALRKSCREMNALGLAPEVELRLVRRGPAKYFGVWPAAVAGSHRRDRPICTIRLISSRVITSGGDKVIVLLYRRPPPDRPTNYTRPPLPTP